MTLKIDSPQGKVTSVKYHREGSGDDPGNVAMDIKVKCTCFGDVTLTPLLGGKPATSFWRGQDKELAFPHLGECDIKTKMEGCKASIQGIELTACNLGVFSFKPLPGGAMDLSFNISAKDVSAKQQNQLKGLLGTDVLILVEGGDIVTAALAGSEQIENEEQMTLQ